MATDAGRSGRSYAGRAAEVAEQGRRLVEQRAFLTVEEGRIALVDVPCSGFRLLALHEG